MEHLADCKDIIHSCSKCGLCQSVCPIYKITGNDCTVSRGRFILLKRLINGELKMSKTINKYLDLCLKCGACSKFCPSGIDVVDIVALAKAEYFKLHKIEKLKSLFLKFVLNFVKMSHFFTQKSKKFNKKVIYFRGCGGVSSPIIKILNSMNIEVITPNFSCCGYPFFVHGDFKSFKKYMDKFYSILDKYDDYDIVTSCATCEQTLKSYSKWQKPDSNKELKITNIVEYIKENNLQLELKKQKRITFHKPCSMDNFEDVVQILKNTKNLEYVEMKDYDKCCGFEGLTNLKERKIMSKLFKEKHENIVKSNAKIVLTSCPACKASLLINSFGKYKVYDLVEFYGKNIK